MKHVELVLDSKAIIGEGPLWDPSNGYLYYIDLMSNTIARIDTQNNQHKIMDAGQNTGTIAFSQNNGLIAALQHGFYFVDFDKQTLEAICDPEADKPNNRFNDGKVGPGGRFWAGTICKDLDSGYGSYDPLGKLYCLDKDYSVRVIEEEVIISNGIAWTEDEKTMYYIDTPRFEIVAYDFDKVKGSVSNKRTVAVVPSTMGSPDGMTIDHEGMLWVCHWGGSVVNRWNPETGEIIDAIKMPVSQPTCCAFGGSNMDELYITSARINLDEEALEREPLAGGVFKVTLDVHGFDSYIFDDSEGSSN